jgi:hypothetical protein
LSECPNASGEGSNGVVRPGPSEKGDEFGDTDGEDPPDAHSDTDSDTHSDSQTAPGGATCATSHASSSGGGSASAPVCRHCHGTRGPLVGIIDRHLGLHRGCATEWVAQAGASDHSTSSVPSPESFGHSDNRSESALRCTACGLPAGDGLGPLAMLGEYVLHADCSTYGPSVRAAERRRAQGGV